MEILIFYKRFVLKIFLEFIKLKINKIFFINCHPLDLTVEIA